jgi:hypothetical protein
VTHLKVGAGGMDAGQRNVSGELWLQRGEGLAREGKRRLRVTEGQEAVSTGRQVHAVSVEVNETRARIAIGGVGQLPPRLVKRGHAAGMVGVPVPAR